MYTVCTLMHLQYRILLFPSFVLSRLGVPEYSDTEIETYISTEKEKKKGVGAGFMKGHLERGWGGGRWKGYLEFETLIHLILSKQVGALLSTPTPTPDQPLIRCPVTSLINTNHLKYSDILTLTHFYLTARERRWPL